MKLLAQNCLLTKQGTALSLQVIIAACKELRWSSRELRCHCQLSIQRWLRYLTILLYINLENNISKAFSVFKGDKYFT